MGVKCFKMISDARSNEWMLLLHDGGSVSAGRWYFPVVKKILAWICGASIVDISDRSAI